MEKVVIRECSLTDITLIAQLEQTLFGSEGYSSLVIRQFYDVCGSLLLVADIANTRVVGYTLGCPKVGTLDAWILAVGVDPKYQQRGIGKSLMTNLLNRLAELGIKNVWLTVEPENKLAISLYTSMGFMLSSQEASYFCSDSLRNIMKKELSV